MPFEEFFEQKFANDDEAARPQQLGLYRYFHFVFFWIILFIFPFLKTQNYTYIALICLLIFQ